ncbi:MAG: cob(I)yrinic acid a,c-diamide adenosyltransferase [Candidatus Gastranaerophilaceae bacterium]
MKINSIASQYYVSSMKQVSKKNNIVENADNITKNYTTNPVKQDALSHLAFLGVQGLKYTSNVTFRGNSKKDKGYVQVYTGNGKGKTTAAMGLALRALGQGKKVSITMFTKGGNNYGEIKAFNNLKPELRNNLTINQAGLDRIVYTSNQNDEDKAIMQKGWEDAKKIINSGKTDIVVLDEINIALDLKMIDEKDVIETIKNKPENVEIVMTGRNAHRDIIAVADLVSNIQMVKHYWNHGVSAREGIEY